MVARSIVKPCLSIIIHVVFNFNEDHNYVDSKKKCLILWICYELGLNQIFIHDFWKMPQTKFCLFVISYFYYESKKIFFTFMVKIVNMNQRTTKI